MLSGSDAPNYPLGLTRRSTQWRSWLPHRKRPPGKVPRFPVRPLVQPVAASPSPAFNRCSRFTL
jgi:hypothetical protein